MAVTFPSTDVSPRTAPAPVAAPTRAEPTPAAPAPVETAGDELERSYARNVAAAWLAGIFVMTAIVTGIAVLAGAADDIGLGGALVIGLCCGFWLAPLAGVVGIGRWASQNHLH